MWILKPIIYLFASVCLTFYKNDVLRLIPNFLIPIKIATVSQYKPQLPTTPAKIIKTYEIYIKNDDNVVNDISLLLNYKFESKTQIDELINELRQSTETKTGLISKFWRLVTFVNFVWLISILGITITFFPAMLKLFGPLIMLLTDTLINIIIQLHKYREEIGYTSLTFLLIQSFHAHKDIGFYLAMTSLVMYGALFMNSIYTRKNTGVNKDLVNMFIHTMLFIPTCLLTLAYESNLLGFISVALFYSMIGFSTMSSGLCWMFGFRGKRELNNCLVSSLIMIPFYFLLSKYIVIVKYFYYGIYVFGVVMYFLALLITTSKFYSKDDEYYQKQIVMTLSLTIGMIVGAYFDIISLYNVSVTFVFLFFSDKIAESSMWKGSEIILVFFGFVTCYLISLWLNTHPNFLESVMYGQ